MAKWSVALFGHYKPNYYLLSKASGEIVERYVDHPGEIDEKVFTLYGCAGVINRAVPGDVVAYKPIVQAHIWSKIERKRFLIVEVDDLSEVQICGFCEEEFNLDSYEKYSPDTEQAWYNKEYLKTLSTIAPEVAQEYLSKNRTILFQEYIVDTQSRCLFPKSVWRKRRHNISLTTLSNKGINTTSMLDTGIEYAPTLSISPDEFYDKTKQVNISSIDGLNTIYPRTENEMIADKSAVEIIAEIRA